MNNLLRLKVALLASAVIATSSPLANAAATHKSVQAWGYISTNQANAGGETKFKWEDDGKTSASAKPEHMMGTACWENLGNTDSQFKIDMVSIDQNQNRTADVDNVDGVTTMTGSGIKLDSSDSVMGNIWPSDGGPSQTSIISDNSILSYGMYADLSIGTDPLDGRDQAYAYVTQAMKTWMGDVRNENASAWDNKTLNDLVFPGAHDAGMWTLAPGINSASNIFQFIKSVMGKLKLPGWLLSTVAGWGAQGTLNVMQNAALTQKDSTATQLAAGIRYFDYRPAALKTPISGITLTGYYHVHSIIPGYNFQNFLKDVTSFLDEAPQEIVIVNIKSSGILTSIFEPIYNSDPKANPNLNESINTVKGLLPPGYNVNHALYTDDFSTLYSKKLGDLVKSNQRLIFYFGTDYNDSYPSDAAGYNTFNPSNLIAQLNKTFNKSAPICSGTPGKFTVFQLQDTATDWVWPNNLVSAPAWTALSSVNGSITLSTKGLFDNQTYPWVVKNLPACSNMVVTLNDFAGNLLALNAKRLTRYRMGLLTSAPTLANQSCTGLEN